MTDCAPVPSRRAVMAALLVSLAGSRAAGAQTAAARFRAVRVDVAPLVAIGGRGPAEVIAGILPGKLAESFADLLAPADTRAPTLVARIDRITLSSFVDVPSEGLNAFGSRAPSLS